MSTKLEAMVGYLSGRGEDARLLEELADPSSEASRFLEATHERSKAMLGGPMSESLGDRPGPKPMPGRRRFAIAAFITAAFVVVGLAYWLADGRLRRLEATFARTHAESREDSLRLEAALDRIAGSKSSTDPAAEALRRVEAGLDRMERRLDAIDHKPETLPPPPPPPKAGSSVAEVRDDLTTLRRELTAAEKANARQVEELRATVQDVARLLRLLIKQAQPPATAPSNEFPGIRPPAGGDLRRGP